MDYAPILLKMSQDVSISIHESIKNGKSFLFEGAQGSLLDIDHGTYPFVTSSNCVAGAAGVGVGLGPNTFNYILGIAKAYTTRVGSGPFPTELDGDLANFIAKRGAEFGSVTGRPRRCGWFDAAALRSSIRISGITGLCVTKLDVLDGLERISICTGYKTPSGLSSSMPIGDSDLLDKCKPIYELHEGWSSPTANVTNWTDLPNEAKRYLDRISELLEIPVVLVSTGPDRENTIVLEDLFS
jgi:adenylosuccinate synthase